MLGKCWRWASVALPLAFAPPTLAQSTQDRDDLTKREIVVTAQFVEQSLVDVPISLSVFSGDDLDRLGVDDFEELARFVPGFIMESQSPNDPTFVMRGISSNIGPAFTEPRVSIFQDGVSISKARGAFVELFDLERVEIAKGPQSTLYGRSALIGAVNVIQNKARLRQTSSSFRAEYGNYNHFVQEAAANLPLGDIAALRLAGRLSQRDGIVENLAGGADFSSKDTWAVRGALRFEPSDRLSVDAIGNFQQDSPTGTGFVSLQLSQSDPQSGHVLSRASPFVGGYLTSSGILAGKKRLGIDRQVYGITGLLQYDLGNQLTFNSVTAWREFKVAEALDADGISLPVISGGDDAFGRQFSQDMRFHWNEGGRLSAFVGGSFFHQRGWQRTPAVFDETLTLAQLSGKLNGGLPGRPANDPAPLAVLRDPAFVVGLLRDYAGSQDIVVPDARLEGIAANLVQQHSETTTNFSRTRAWDVFADATFRAAPRVELSVGVRYSHDTKRSAISGMVLNGRSILGSYIAALSLPGFARGLLLSYISRPGAAAIPQSSEFPVPLIGLGGQPTANNGDIDSANLNDGGFSFRTIARYAPDPDSSIYAVFARGRRPAELSARTPTAPFDASRFENVPAESVDSFEIGAKTWLLDRRLYLDAALFHYRYRNFQTTEQIGILFVTTNAGKARSEGLETQFRYRPSDWIEVFGSYAWNHSRFRSGARRGNRFRLSPDHSASLGLFARAPVKNGEISFVPSLTWRSKTFFDGDNDLPVSQQPPNALVADNIQDEVQGAFALANARLAYGPQTGRWKMEVFVENIFNTRYLRDAGNVGDFIGLATAVRGDPRTYGISFRLLIGSK